LRAIIDIIAFDYYRLLLPPLLILMKAFRRFSFDTPRCLLSLIHSPLLLLALLLLFFRYY